MVARTVAAVHGVEGVGRTILVGLVGIDALRIAEAQFQTLQNLVPSEVVAQASVDARVRVHVPREVAVVLQHVERIVLVGVALAVGGTVGGDGVSAHLFWNVARACQHQVVVLLGIRSAHLQEGLVLLAVVTADGQVGCQPLRNLHVDTGAIVPAVVVELAQVTVLLEVGDTTEVAHLLGCTADVHGMAHRATCLPVFVEQVHVLALHGFQFVGLEQRCGVVQRSVRGVGGCNHVVQAAILIGAEHVGA